MNVLHDERINNGKDAVPDDEPTHATGAETPATDGAHANPPPSGADATADDAVLRAALDALASGLSIIPISPFGGRGEGKQPVGSWKKYQTVAADRQQVEAWFRGHPDRGLAVAGGYSDLEILDWDDAKVFDLYVQAAEAAGMGELLHRVFAGYLERTPKGGAHALFFCPGAVEGNQKLAMRPEVDERGMPVLDERGHQKLKTLIETRGARGYCVVAPSPGTVHQSGKPYVLQSGGFDQIVTIAPDERQVLFALAATFDECPEPPPKKARKVSGGGKSGAEDKQRPGDLYNASAGIEVWKELLEPHDWTLTADFGGKQYWLRPGGEKTCSAIVGGRKNVLVCFSSAGHPFRMWSAFAPVSYTPFAAFSVLFHGSDCAEAYRAGAKELARRGYRSVTPGGAARARGAWEEAGSEGGEYSDSASGSGKPLPPMAWDHPIRLAESFLETNVVAFIKKSAFLYDGRCYKYTSGEYLESLVYAHLEQQAAHELQRREKAQEDEGDDENKKPPTLPKPSGKLVNEVLWAVRARCQLGDEVQPNTWLRGNLKQPVLSVANGLLDPVEQKLHPHTPDYFGLACSPIEYDPTARMPTRWIATLTELMEGDEKRVNFLQEVAGCCLDPMLVFKYFILLHGPGDNGKSVYQKVLMFLLGEKNISAESLNQIRTDKFARFNLLGKFANIAADESYFESNDEAELRKLTGNDPIKFEDKYKSALYAVNTAKLIAGCNNLPRFADRSKATWNRLRIVPFNYRVPEAKQVPEMLNREFWEDELPGILNWAIAGLARYKARQCRLPSVAAITLVGDEHRLDCQPAERFLTEHYEYKDGGSAFSWDIYAAYKEWCEEQGYTRAVLTSPVFGKTIGQVFGDAGSRNARDGKRVGKLWEGIHQIDRVL